MNETGGGTPQVMGLSDMENRILCILGPTFYKGVGRSENGLSTFGISKPNLINVMNVTKCAVRNDNSKELKTTSEIANFSLKDLHTSSQEKASDLPLASSSQKDIFTQQQAPM